MHLDAKDNVYALILCTQAVLLSLVRVKADAHICKIWEAGTMLCDLMTAHTLLVINSE